MCRAHTPTGLRNGSWRLVKAQWYRSSILTYRRANTKRRSLSLSLSPLSHTFVFFSFSAKKQHKLACLYVAPPPFPFFFHLIIPLPSSLSPAFCPFPFSFLLSVLVCLDDNDRRGKAWNVVQKQKNQKKGQTIRTGRKGRGQKRLKATNVQTKKSTNTGRNAHRDRYTLQPFRSMLNSSLRSLTCEDVQCLANQGQQSCIEPTTAELRADIPRSQGCASGQLQEGQPGLRRPGSYSWLGRRMQETQRRCHQKSGPSWEKERKNERKKERNIFQWEGEKEGGREGGERERGGEREESDKGEPTTQGPQSKNHKVQLRKAGKKEEMIL